MIPIYGFLEGDTLGLLLLAPEEMTMDALGKKLQRMARVRVAPLPHFKVFLDHREIPLDATVKQVGIKALDRIDVRKGDELA